MHSCVKPNYLRSSNFLPKNVKNKQKLTFQNPSPLFEIG